MTVTIANAAIPAMDNQLRALPLCDFARLLDGLPLRVVNRRGSIAAGWLYGPSFWMRNNMLISLHYLDSPFA